MNKQVRSWSQPKGRKNLIGRKKIDWSMFVNGTHIPKEFHQDFAEANHGNVEPGQTRKIILLIDDKRYEASLTNIVRKDANYKPALQLRYDKNEELKSLMKRLFKVSYNYIKTNKRKDSKSPVLTPPDLEEFIEFYKTDTPFVYEVNILNKVRNNSLNFWWVNQGKTHNQEKNGGYLWAPQKSQQGRPLSHHVDLLKANIGDIVFCYSESEIRAIGIVKKNAIKSPKPTEIANHNWQEDGYLLELTYYPLKSTIHKNVIPISWREKEVGPFDKNGNVKQGYFFSVSEEFIQKVFNQFKEKFPDDIKNKLMGYEFTSGIGNVGEKGMSNEELSSHIHAYIQSKGFLYSEEEVSNLFLSLKTKPFVILSGISGTGKTKMVQWFAESLGANEQNGQLTIIPVRPDWNDGSDLLGYVDIKGDFKEGPLTKIIREADANPEYPYFVLLDEMNLARVEHYFSDILSIMESRKRKGNGFVTSVVLSKDITKYEKDLMLPSNLYVIGTVNMDETTHPFSKKVLDRANTIEFNRVELSNLDFLKDLEEVAPQPIKSVVLNAEYLHLKDVYPSYPELVERTTAFLERVNQELKRMNAHVGYRVRDEICFYLAYNEQGELMSEEQALDHCILQKILPRISGSDKRVEDMLIGLFRVLTNKEYMEDGEAMLDAEKSPYPYSAKKVLEMLGRLKDDGFTSFWIS